MKRRTFLLNTSYTAAGLILPEFSFSQPPTTTSPAIFKWLLKLGEKVGTAILESTVGLLIEKHFFKEKVAADIKSLDHTFKPENYNYYDQRTFILQYGDNQNNFFFPLIRPDDQRSYPNEAWLPFFNYQKSFKGLSKVLTYPAVVGLTQAATQIIENDIIPQYKLSEMIFPAGPQTDKFIFEREGLGVCLYNSRGGTLAINYDMDDQGLFKGSIEFSGHSNMGFRKQYAVDFYEE